MVKYRDDRERINVDALGSLYIDKELDDNFRPVIYIGGQMEHRLHKYENKTGITFDVGHGLFDGSWFYEYSTKKKYTKSNINTLNFADNLIKSLEVANLDDVDIITESYGGLIAACASKSKRIHKVVAIHPPILGTPLASNDTIKDALDKLEKEQRKIAKWVNRIVNDRFGFEQDNANGINNSKILDSIDFSKLTVVGSNMDRENDKSKTAKRLYDLIYALTGEKSDGVVLFDEEKFKSFGINYIKEKCPTNHFDAGSEKNIMSAASQTLERFKSDEDEEREVTGFIDSYYYDDTSYFDEEEYDDGLEFLSIDKLFEEGDTGKYADLREQVEQERKMALSLFTGNGNR